MATQHLKYMHTGINLDTGAEYHAAALVTIDDDDVTYTLRSIDRSQTRRFQVPRSEATLVLALLAAIAEMCGAEQDRQPAT